MTSRGPLLEKSEDFLLAVQFLKDSASRLTVIPKRRIVMPELYNLPPGYDGNMHGLRYGNVSSYIRLQNRTVSVASFR